MEKTWTKTEIKEKLATDAYWLSRGILAIHARQTDDERNSKRTKYKNRMGFASPDARFLSSLAEWIKRGGHLTERQIAAARCRMLKYAGQLARIANAKTYKQLNTGE